MLPNGLLHVVRQRDLGVEVLRVAGELDITTRAVFDEAATAAVSDLRPGDMLVVDLLNLTFIGSVGLNGLIELRTRCDSRAARLRIIASGGAVGRALRLTGMDHILPVYESLADAVAA